VDTWYAAMALGGMVAKFAEMMFIGGVKADVHTAVDQLTLLWANALGIAERDLQVARKPRKR